MKKQIAFITLLLSLISVTEIVAQQTKQIKIEHAGVLTINEKEYPGAKILTRNDQQQVHIIHGTTNLWCDQAIHYRDEKFIEAYGNVKMIDSDTITMTSQYIEYSGKTELAFANKDVVLKSPNSTITSDTLYMDKLKQQAFYRSGGTVVKDSSGTITSKIGLYYMNEKKFKFVEDVVLTNDSTTIKSNFFDFYEDTGHAYLFGPSTITTEDSKTYCEKGFYDTENKSGYALKDSKIYYDNRIIEGDSLYFDNKTSFASATNNIKVTDTINHSIIKGHYAEVFKEKDSLFIIKRALAITVQENDSIYMHADKLTVTGKPDHRIVKAYYNAKLYKSDISAKADSIHADQKTGLTQLINLERFASKDNFSKKRKPILWNIENQMTGDTIHLLSNPETERLDSLKVFNNAFIISKDTISKNGYNQINGMWLKGVFNEENTLRQVDINKNAQSIFYVRDEFQELIGIDKAKSGSISMLFDNGDIEEYSRFNQVDAKTYPESKYPEKEKLLKGFDWREEERPLSVEDLFKDDPPLNLPEIKGLEDYIPQDMFFDEDMLERIAMVGKHSSFIDTKNENPVNSKKLNTGNLLKSPNDFNNKLWQKVNLSIEPNSSLDVNKNRTADKLINKNYKNATVYQIINNIKGKLQFSIWLKGKGSVIIKLQEKTTNFKDLSNLKIDLNNRWEEHVLLFNKKVSKTQLKIVVDQIQKTDVVYATEAKLIEVSD